MGVGAAYLPWGRGRAEDVGIYKLYNSSNGGASWLPVVALSAVVRAVTIAPGSAPTWFAGRWADRDASVLVSTDHGAHWQAVAPGSYDRATPRLLEVSN